MSNRFHKQPYAQVWKEFDFTQPATDKDGLVSGETINSVQVLAFRQGAVVTAEVISASAIFGQVVQVLVFGGVNSRHYDISCRIISSLGQKLEVDAEMTVYERSS